MEDTQQNERHGGGCFLASIITAVLVGIIIIVIIALTTGFEGQSVSKDDIDITIDGPIGLTTDFTLTAYEDIEDLEVSFNFMDENHRILTTVPKHIGNVQKGRSYLVTITIVEYATFKVFDIEYFSYDITNGKVK